MADIGKYKAHQKMMQDPERKKAYIDAMKRRKKDTASRNKIGKPSRSMMVDTTTSAYGDAGRGRPVPKFLDRTPRKPKPTLQDRRIPRKPKPTLQDRRRKLPPKEDNYGQFSKGGEVCRGAGAAIKGTKFEGVF